MKLLDSLDVFLAWTIYTSGDAPFLLIVNHNGAQFFVTFTHDYNDKCRMISKGNLEDFNTFLEMLVLYAFYSFARHAFVIKVYHERLKVAFHSFRVF